jgi:hypothetical protein
LLLAALGCMAESVRVCHGWMHFNAMPSGKRFDFSLDGVDVFLKRSQVGYERLDHESLDIWFDH